MDLARLDIDVNSKSVSKADAELAKLTNTGGKTETFFSRFRKNTNDNTAATDKFGSSLNRTSGILSGFKGLIAGVVAGASLGAFVTLSDNATQFSNSLQIAGLEGQNFLDVQGRIVAAANQNGAALNSLGALYLKTSGAAKDLGTSQEDSLKLLEGTAAAIKLAGVSSAQASGAILGLGQSLTTGRVQAEDFNQILEGVYPLAQAAARGLEEAGGSVGKLKSIINSKDGLSSGEFFAALNKGLAETVTMANGAATTFGQAFQSIQNSLTLLVGNFNNATGIGTFFVTVLGLISSGILFLANNIEFLIPAVLKLTPLLLAVFGPTLLAGALSLASAIAGPLVGAFTALAVAIAANPLVAFGVAMVTILSYLVDWQIAIRNLIQLYGILKATIAEALTSLGIGDFSAGLNDGIQIYLNADNIAEQVTGAATTLGDKALSAITAGGDNAASKIGNAMVAGGDSAASKIGNAVMSAADTVNAAYDRLNGAGKVLVEGTDKFLNKATGEITKAGDQAGGAIGDKMLSAGEGAGDSVAKQFEGAVQKSSPVIYSTIESAFATLGPILDVFVLAMSQLRADINKTNAEAAKLIAETRKTNQEAENLRNNRAPRPGVYRSGTGGNGYGSTGNGGIPAPVAPTPTTPGVPTPTPTPGETPITNINLIDPNEIINALATAAGSRVLINVMRTNREELVALMGPA